MPAYVLLTSAECHPCQTNANNVRIDVASHLIVSACRPRQMADVDASDMRVDLAAGGHIAWANDLETGRMYWTWPSSVMDLLRPAYPGQLAKIQRNLLNLVGLVDPGTLPGLRSAP